MRYLAPATVYRFFNSDGDLLYIGCSTNFATRLAMHCYQTPWFTEATRVELEHHADSKQAYDAEATAIAAEAPRYNVQRSGDRVAAKQRRRDAYDRASARTA